VVVGAGEGEIVEVAVVVPDGVGVGEMEVVGVVVVSTAEIL
jgi:hypothetical protein